MRTLIIAPHPDDEAIGCSGIVLRRIAEGGEVFVLFLTLGEHGCPGINITEAASIRQLEAITASRVLGSTIADFWYLPDGGLVYSDELRDRLAQKIQELNIDEIYVTGEQESHPDHRVAGRLVREYLALGLPDSPNAYAYEVWTPNLRAQRVLDITHVIDKKLEAIRAHKSQVERIAFDTAALSLARYRGIMHGRCEYAEAFSKIRPSGKDRMKVTVALFTWSPSIDNPRHEYAVKTLEAVLKNLNVGSDNDLAFHIADDGSDPLHVGSLVDLCMQYGYTPTLSNAERGGYGRSYNLMMQSCHSTSDLILPLEDDWELTRPLNLEPVIRAIDLSNGEMRCVRLGYLGYTQELKGRLYPQAGQSFLLFDPDSAEPHIFAGHPRLETVEYEKDVGAWPEGEAAGQTEWIVAHRWPARIGVAWPLDLGIAASQDWGTLFAHIGSEGTGEITPSKEAVS